MKTAYVHDRLYYLGGAEKVFFDLIEKDIQKTQEVGVIYTLFSDRKSIVVADKTIPVVTALPRMLNNMLVYLDRRKYFDYRNMFVVYPLLTKLLWWKIRRQSPKYILISSFATAKNILPVGKVLTSTVSLYLHSPMQYVWENYDEYKAKLTGRRGRLFREITPKLQERDKQPRHYDTVLVNSHYTKTCAKKYYDIDNAVIDYPALAPEIIQAPIAKQALDYFIYVGRLVKFIREADKVVQVCNQLNLPLIVMGSGPDEAHIKSIAGDSITFVGHISDIQEKIHLISHARGLINITKESCGIGTLEALNLGVPVLGFQGGATPEFVNDSNGVLVKNKDLDSLMEGLEIFQQKNFDRQAIKSAAGSYN